MKKKRWTEKQIKEKIRSIEHTISYRRKDIRRAEEEIRDNEILLDYFKRKLAKKYNNPSSVKYGGPNGETEKD